jgi:hypothetical protein
MLETKDPWCDDPSHPDYHNRWKGVISLSLFGAMSARARINARQRCDYGFVKRHPCYRKEWDIRSEPLAARVGEDDVCVYAPISARSVSDERPSGLTVTVSLDTICRYLYKGIKVPPQPCPPK